MTELTLAKAQTIIAAALAHAREKSLAPMAVAVLDARGVLKAFAAEEGTALRRADIAIGKAHGALSMGVGSRTLGSARKSGRISSPRSRRLLAGR